MTRDDRLTNLMFLLSLPSLAAGCATGGDDPTTSSPPVVNPTVDSATDDGDVDTGNSGVDGPSMTDTGNSGVDGPSMTDGPSLTDGPGVTSYVDTGYMDSGYGETAGYTCGKAMPPMVGPISAACMQYASVNVECYYEGNPACIPVSEAYCQYAIDYGTMENGPACGMAYEELFVCLSQLPCELLMDKMEDCPGQFQALDEACPF